VNRELSWLDFNGRVLALAEDRTQPLLERAKFLAIFCTNLDEFFQIRVSGLLEQLAAGLGATTPEGLSPREQLGAIRAVIAGFLERQTILLQDDLGPAMEKEGIRFVNWEELLGDDRRTLAETFEERIFPVLTPLSVDPAHPFPYISSLSLNLAAIVRDPETGERRFARVKVPPLLSRFVALDDGERFIPLEQVIAAHLHRLFPGMHVVAHHVFRVTRDADVDVEEDEAEDLLDAIQDSLHRREREAHAVRLEIDRSMPTELRELLQRELGLADDAIYVVDTLLDLSALWAIVGLDRPELKDEPWPAVTDARLIEGEATPDIFTTIRSSDILVHHPYDSFATSVQNFVEQAADDPNVLAIKQTLYRTSGPESALLRALARAAESGKQVVALVELKARFDEAANINWARTLEQHGVHVVYGVVGLKTHAKLLLVVRSEGDRIRRYVHLATGNYNGKTAKLYEDVGILTCDPDLGADVTDLFNFLTGYSAQHDYRKLLVAPLTLRRRLTELIERESKPGGRITFKLNSLVDPRIIDALYDASAAGASIDLIIRGICCLRAGVPGLSENIRVRSIVGRYLEHSRIYRFGEPPHAEAYIASADLMQRNLDRRVEAAIPIEHPDLLARIDEILVTGLADDALAWELQSDDTWRKLPVSASLNAQRRLYEIAVEHAAAGTAGTGTPTLSS